MSVVWNKMNSFGKSRAKRLVKEKRRGMQFIVLPADMRWCGQEDIENGRNKTLL